MNQLLPFISDILLLIVGSLCYAFSRSVFWIKDESKKVRLEQFRKDNGRVLRIGGLLLIAISLVNISFSIFSISN
jgi:hypothetical protein